MVFASQLRTGMVIVFENQNYRLISADYHPGQGKMGGVTHARLQNIDTGTFRDHSFRGELKLAELAVEKKSMEFLYADGDQYCFMNPENYEQLEIGAAIVGPRAHFLQPGMAVTVEFVSGRPCCVAVPDMLELAVADTAPASHQQGDYALKPARLANGVEVMVPQFIKSGDVIRLSLDTLKYVDRVRADAKAKNA